MELYEYSGAGNNFVVLDGRKEDVSAFRAPERVRALCKERHTDGLMILEGPRSAGADFGMCFFNPDGTGGMMCGNGGRCIAAFADAMGLEAGRQSPEGHPLYRFDAPDGLHTAEILRRPAPEAPCWTVRLGMIDVRAALPCMGGYFLNTGTRHLVLFVPDVEAVDVAAEGSRLRHDPGFAPEGTNVNFVSVHPDGLHVRTFEKGVEAETLACGTGLTASAIAAYVHGLAPSSERQGRVFYTLTARRGDRLQVDFVHGPESIACDVFLTGPAEQINRL